MPKGGVLGRRLEVISRDDGANPGEAVRVAEELVTREGVSDDRRHVPVAHRTCGHRISPARRRCSSLPPNPLTDKITWQNGNRYVPPARHDLCRRAMLDAGGDRCQEKTLGTGLSELRVWPVGCREFQVCMMKKAAADVRNSITEQAPPLGRSTPARCAQAIDDAEMPPSPTVLFGGDLARSSCAKAVTRGVFKNRTVVSLALRRARISRSARRRGSGRLGRCRLSMGRDQDQGHLAFVDAYKKKGAAGRYPHGSSRRSSAVSVNAHRSARRHSCQAI